MPIRIVELPRQKTESHYLRPGCSREYTISGTYEKVEAQLALLASPLCPAQDFGVDSESNVIPIYRDDIQVNEEGGGGCWHGSARYEASGISSDLQFTIGSTSKKTYQALEHIEVYDLINGGTNTTEVPDYDGAIGVNGDEIEGVDIEVGEVHFSLTKRYRRSSIPPSYFNQLMEFLGDRTPTNDATYTITWQNVTLTFPEQSLRLRSAPLKWSSANELEYVYNFHYSRPITTADAFTIGSSSTITMKGQHYGWISYRLTVDSNQHTLRTAEGFHVERVYPTRSFNFLQL